MNRHTRFVSIISNRSKKNLESFNLLFNKRLYGNCMSIIRMELDSYIRLYYYQSKCIDREAILESFFNGERLKENSGAYLTDRKLVDFGQNCIGQDAIYNLACNFIHLSKFHDDYDVVWRDGLFKKSVIDVINQHYISNFSYDAAIEDVLVYLPKVMYKIHYHIHRIIGIVLD